MRNRIPALNWKTLFIFVFASRISFKIGIWDCSDASDEEGIFIIDELSAHNEAIVNLNELKRKCRALYRVRPLVELCDYTKEYPCLKNVQNLEELWNFTIHKPCIPLAQLGDSIIQCYGARDEKSTLKRRENGAMLGTAFLCSRSNWTIELRLVCEAAFMCPYRENSFGCLRNPVPISTSNNNCSSCDYNPTGVFCLNGTYIEEARCSDGFDCAYGEDEYMCDPDCLSSEAAENAVYYRFTRHSKVFPRTTLKISDFPSSLDYATENQQPTSKNISHESSIAQNSTDAAFARLKIAYNCNRGVAVHELENNNLSCFCPPSYYGEHCEYYSDRLTVVINLDYTNSPYRIASKHSVVLQVLAQFLFEENIIDHCTFRVRPADEMETYVKHKFFLLYSRADNYLAHKQKRYFNRTDIIANHPHSVRFEIYELPEDRTIKLIGFWRFYIYFDYLPSFRLAKVLWMPKNDTADDPCLSNPCHQRSKCQRILNENETSAFVCLCNSPFYGKECELVDENCSSFCAPGSICKPTHNGILTSNEQPVCLCSLHYYGPRCYLRYAVCESQPCLNNGSCIEVFDPAQLIRYACKCTVSFFGDQCEYEGNSIHIQMKMLELPTSSATILASLVQYFDRESIRQDLRLRHQQLSSDLRLTWRYDHGQNTAPVFAVSKLYDSNYRLNGPSFYLLYIQQNKEMINLTIELNQVNLCAHVLTFMNKTSKFIYHQG